MRFKTKLWEELRLLRTSFLSWWPSITSHNHKKSFSLKPDGGGIEEQRWVVLWRLLARSHPRPHRCPLRCLYHQAEHQVEPSFCFSYKLVSILFQATFSQPGWSRFAQPQRHKKCCDQGIYFSFKSKSNTEQEMKICENCRWNFMAGH